MVSGAPKARQAMSHSVRPLCRIETIDFRVRQQYPRYRKGTIFHICEPIYGSQNAKLSDAREMIFGKRTERH